MPQVYDHYARAAEWTDGFKFCPECATPLVWQECGGRPRPVCPACGFIQFRNPAPAVSILIADGGRVLLGRRSGPPGEGTWAFPSGYVEYDEDFLTAAIREAREETGLEVEIVSILNVVSAFVSPRFHFLTVCLVARVIGGEPAPGDDLTAVTWFPIRGPLPEMGFQEDVDALSLYASGFSRTPVGPEYAKGNASLTG
jgi:ADP-ribose pyrophosphatase YjhB (NUDIX family)